MKQEKEKPRGQKGLDCMHALTNGTNMTPVVFFFSRQAHVLQHYGVCLLYTRMAVTTQLHPMPRWLAGLRPANR